MRSDRSAAGASALQQALFGLVDLAREVQILEAFYVQSTFELHAFRAEEVDDLAVMERGVPPLGAQNDRVRNPAASRFDLRPLFELVALLHQKVFPSARDLPCEVHQHLEICQRTLPWGVRLAGVPVEPVAAPGLRQ